MYDLILMSPKVITFISKVLCLKLYGYVTVSIFINFEEFLVFITIIKTLSKRERESCKTMAWF
jgi:hypothetical protein